MYLIIFRDTEKVDCSNNHPLQTGNREGKIYVWEVQSSPPVLIARYFLLQDFSYSCLPLVLLLSY